MFLKTLQLLFLILPLPIAILAFTISDRFGSTGFLASCLAILGGYAAAIYLTVFGDEGNWQHRLASWVRNNVLQSRVCLSLAITIMTIAILAEVTLLLRGPYFELRGTVVIDNRPCNGVATIRVAGCHEEFKTDSSGHFTFDIRDERQTALTLTAEFKNLTGLREVERGAFLGFQIPLDKKVVELAVTESGLTRSVAVVGRKTELNSFREIVAGRERLTAVDGPFVLSAARQGEQAYELSEQRHGAFTLALLESLRDRSLNTYRDLAHAVTNRIAAFNIHQHPVFVGKLDYRFLGSDGTLGDTSDFLAVVVGISQYQDPRIGDTRFSVADAIGIYQWLLEVGARPEQVHLLLNESATRERIMSALSIASQTVDANSTVLFYYSGVGVVAEDTDGDEVDGVDEYLTCSDSLAANLPLTAISDDALGSPINRISSRSKNVILIFDTSFAVPTR